jgi:hypothetical protein
MDHSAISGIPTLISKLFAWRSPHHRLLPQTLDSHGFDFFFHSSRFFNNILHLTEWWSFVPKVILDQTTWGPFWNNSYILLIGLMKLDSFENIWSDMKRSTIPLIVSGLKLWPLAHCITYGLVPMENRVLWVDMVEILWVTILATQAAAASVERESQTTQLDAPTK